MGCKLSTHMEQAVPVGLSSFPTSHEVAANRQINEEIHPQGTVPTPAQVGGSFEHYLGSIKDLEGLMKP